MVDEVSPPLAEGEGIDDPTPNSVTTEGADASVQLRAPEGPNTVTTEAVEVVEASSSKASTRARKAST
jgi:hypothetical protein